MNAEKINQSFKKFAIILMKHRISIILLFLVFTLICLIGLKGLKTDASNDAWFFDDDPVIVMEDKFENIFGSTDMAGIHMKMENVFTAENLEKIRKLSNEIEGKVPFVKNVTSITNLEYMTGSEFSIDIGDLVPEIIPRGKNELDDIGKSALSKKSIKDRLISSDLKETWVVVELEQLPKDWKKDKKYKAYLEEISKKYPELYSKLRLDKRVEAPDFVVGTIINEIAEKYSDLNAKTTGAPCISVNKKMFFQKETPKLLGGTIIISIILLIFFMRSFKNAIFPIIIAIGNMIIVLGIEGYFNTTVQVSVLPVPILLGMAVSIGYSMHIFNSFNSELNIYTDKKDAVIKAVEKNGWSLLFSALTTISALASFLFLKIRVLNWIGITSALIIVLTYTSSIVVLPIFLSFGKGAVRKKNIQNNGKSYFENKMINFNRWILNHSFMITTIFVIINIAVIYGLSKMKVDFSDEKGMGTKVEYVNKMLEIEKSQIGSFNNYDIGIEFNENDMAKDPENLKKLEFFIKKIEEFELTKRTTSVLNSIKEINQVLNDGNEKYYSIPETKEMIAQSLLLYENAGGAEASKWVDYDYKKLHVRVEISKYLQNEILDETKKIEELGKEIFPDANVFVSGSISKFSDMSKKVSLGQIKSIIVAMAIISIMLMAAFGSIKIGIIAMIPNIFPIITVGGVMGLLNIPLDMITATIMPMIIGLAVDDTIHFISHAKLEYEKSGDYDNALEKTFLSTGKSIIMTSVILIINYTAYFSSSANLYVNFGLLTIAGIFSALMTDLFITPICIKKLNAFKSLMVKKEIYGYSSEEKVI